jgi:hypothetical protein
MPDHVSVSRCASHETPSACSRRMGSSAPCRRSVSGGVDRPVGMRPARRSATFAPINPSPRVRSMLHGGDCRTAWCVSVCLRPRITGIAERRSAERRAILAMLLPLTERQMPERRR